MKQVPNLTLEQIEELYVELKKSKMQNDILAGQVAAMQNQITNERNIAIIIASALFRQLGYIEENRIQLVNSAMEPVRITQPLIYSISQKKINDLEFLYPGEAPNLGFVQQTINGEAHLVFKLVGDAEAQQDVQQTLN